MMIELKVVPSSGKQEINLNKNFEFKVHLKNPPEGGKANVELVKFLSKKLKLPQENISIILGKTERKKKIKIEGLTEEQFFERLGFGDRLGQRKVF